MNWNSCAHSCRYLYEWGLELAQLENVQRLAKKQKKEKEKKNWITSTVLDVRGWRIYSPGIPYPLAVGWKWNKNTERKEEDEEEEEKEEEKEEGRDSSFYFRWYSFGCQWEKGWANVA